MDAKPPELDPHTATFRRVFTWIIGLGTLLVVGIALYYCCIKGFKPEIFSIITEHYAVIIGMPCAAVASLIVVVLLGASYGALEFEAIGFKFKGASGPVVLWILCYLAIAASIKILW